MPQLLLGGAPTGCWTNLGDEAILAGMLQSLRATIPGVEVTVVSSSPVGFFERYGCGEVRYDDLDALTAQVAASDAVLLGGGSIFFDYWGCDPGAVLTPAHQGLSLWASLATLASRARVPVAIYGAGVGPLRTPEGEQLTRTVFEQAAVITVRDRASAATLAALGIDGSSIAVTGDPALAVELPAPVRSEGDQPVLGVALRPWDVGADPDRWPAAIADALDRHLEVTGGTVLFVPCHRAVSWPLTDDTAAGEAVRARMTRRDQTRTVDVELPWTERAAILTGCDLVLAMRYHASLLALGAGVPSVGLRYDPKVAGLLDDWGFGDFGIDMDGITGDAVYELLERASRERDDLAARAIDAAARARAQERDTARAVAALLRPKRVAILTNRLLDRETGAPCIGGAERYALDLARLLRDLGLDPTFFQREGEWGTGDYFGFPVVALPRGESFSEFEVGVAEAFHEQTGDFDHVICLMPNYASGPLRDDAIVVCHGVWWDHDLWDHLSFRTPEWWAHLERVFTRPRRVVSVDTNSISVVRALYPDAASRMTCIPNAVDTDEFHPPAERPSEVPRITFPRRADIVRGPQLVGPILEQVPDPCLVRWVGDGDPGLLADLRAVSERDGRLRVETASFEDMPNVYRDTDICVIPTVASEGQSLACLEAMASGCAVVVTRVGGLPELIEDGVDGLVCDPTAESLAPAIRRLARDPELRARLGASARRRAERHSSALWRSRWAEVFAEEGWICETTPAVPYDIVCFSIIDWEFRWQRPQQMMSVWARRGRRVFYLDVTEFLPPGGDPVVVEPLAEGIWKVRIALPDGFDPYNGIHADGFAAAGLEALDVLRQQFGIEGAVSVVELAGWTPLAEGARDAFGWPVVYDCMDDWGTFPGFTDSAEFRACEESLVSTADLLVVSGRTIQERWAEARPDVLLARNAADFAFYQHATGPDPLPDVVGPVAGFFGAIVEWFDVEMVARAARARPDVTFVLVGGVQRIEVDELEALPNVRFVGQQPYETMPLYLRRFDVCLVPFRVSPVTDGMDVVKLYEYLSLGKPVVSTRIREMVPYGDVVYLVDDEEHFVQQLDRALAEDDVALCLRRTDLARQNTWDERVDRIEQALLECGVHLVPGAGSSEARWGRSEADAARDESVHLRAELDAYRRSHVVRTANVYWRFRRMVDRRVH